MKTNKIHQANAYSLEQLTMKRGSISFFDLKYAVDFGSFFLSVSSSSQQLVAF